MTANKGDQSKLDLHSIVIIIIVVIIILLIITRFILLHYIDYILFSKATLKCSLADICSILVLEKATFVYP